MQLKVWPIFGGFYTTNTLRFIDIKNAHFEFHLAIFKFNYH